MSVDAGNVTCGKSTGKVNRKIVVRTRLNDKAGGTVKALSWLVCLASL